MEVPTIVRKTKDYLLIKVPLPKLDDTVLRVRKNNKMTPAGKRLWKVIREGEKEYREGKTIRASSIDGALKIYERRQKNKLR